MAGGLSARIIRIVGFNAVTYVLIGLPLAVFPGFVRFQLDDGAALAGGLIGLQYVATLLTRSLVGSIADTRGPKTAVLFGLGCAAVSGGCILGGAYTHAPTLVLCWLAASRIWLGAAESFTGTGCIAWGIGRFGGGATAEVISWNGVASYGGIAVGAPLGVVLARHGGLADLGAASVVMPLLALAGAAATQGSAVIAGARMSMLSVARVMAPYGLCLAGGSIGFGAIVSFLALYYAAHEWGGAAYALSMFGFCFVLVRLLFSGAIRRFGGFASALVSFGVEVVGLVLIWAAPAPWCAMLGAGLSGLGFSLIFPALAVEGLRHVSATSRGAAVAVFTVFLDVGLGGTGPLAGVVGGHFGYPAVFAAAALVVAGALGLAFGLMRADSGLR